MAIRIDAAADAIYLPEASCPDVAYWACSLWFYLTTDMNFYGTVINIDNDYADYAGLWLYSDGTTFQVTSNADFNSPGSATVGAWHHCYFINNNGTGSGGFRLASSTTYSTETCTGATIGTTGTIKLTFGNDLYGDPPDRIDGRIAHVKVWSGSGNLPTAAQIQAEGSRIAPIKQGGLWGWYPMFDAATAATDYSGNGRTLTTAGTLTTEDGPPIGWGASPSRVNAPVSQGGRNPVAMGFVVG